MLSQISVYSKQFFLLFLFRIYKMVDSMDIYKLLNINIVIVMKNPETLKFVPDHLETEKMCKHGVKKYSHNAPYR